jgi:hypothetical protein
VVPSAERGSPFLRCEGEGAVFVALPTRGRSSSAAPDTSGTWDLSDPDAIEEPD